MKITLMRHGKPSVVELFKRSKITSSDMPDLIRKYNESGVIRDVPPPESSLEKALLYEKVVCSPLKRSIDSADHLGLTITDRDKMFTEAELPVFSIPIIKLSPQIWTILFRILWMLGFSGKIESSKAFKLRAKQASQQLIQLAEKHGGVILIGHGMINRQLGKELLKSDWKSVPEPKSKHSLSYKYWGYSEFQK